MQEKPHGIKETRTQKNFFEKLFEFKIPNQKPNMNTETKKTEDFIQRFRLGNDVGTITKIGNKWKWEIMGESGLSDSLLDATDTMVDEWNIQHDND